MNEAILTPPPPYSWWVIPLPIVMFLTFTLSQWFSNLNPCQNHLWDVLKHMFLGPFHPQSFCLSSVGIVVAVQLLSHVRLFATAWTAARQASLSFTISQSMLKLMSTELVMPSNHLILCRPLLLLLSIFPSIKVFSNKSVLHIRWPKY